MPKYTMTIDEAIAALQKAKLDLEEFVSNEGDTPTLCLVLPQYGIATNVIDLIANSQDGSVRVIIRD